MQIIIINGPCSVGKSTIAAKLHQALPLSFLLDIDAQRRFFSHYREKSEESRVASYQISEAIIDSCLDMKHDVIVDKILFEHGILDSFYEIARKKDAEVKEIILWAPKDVVMNRANSRGWREGSMLTPEKCELFWEKINEIKDQRPKAVIIDTSKISESEVVNQVLGLLKS